MNDDLRPDPDILLRAIKRQDEARSGGMLQIFFGMAAGAGKTYTMLEAAQARRKEGADVVVGIVETHGRAETASLLNGLEIISRASIPYRDVVLTEMDIDAILARKPTLVLVDELAHTNVPGSRHPKRWQDVLELLDAGINVYTTLNVQHIESRKSTVENITGITIRETVPDAVLDRATQIELVDITPEALLQRLREGKVYLGEKAAHASDNFFKEDRLTALRELALRLTAEKVDSDLHDLQTAQGVSSWKLTERLMVAISHSPLSEALIRATRRLATSLDADWIAVHVDTGRALSPQNQQILARHIRLVQELGGEVISTADTSIGSALERVASQQRVTQLVIGRPAHRWFDFLPGVTLHDQLARADLPFHLLVLRHDPRDLDRLSPQSARWTSSTTVRHYLIAAGTIVGIALVSALLKSVIGYKAIGLFFLLATLLLSLSLSLGAVLTAAILSSIIWNYFFIPPVGTFYISDVEDVLLVLAYLLAALVTGTLTARTRIRQRLLRQREDRTELLYDLAKQLVASTDIQAALVAISERTKKSLAGELDLLTVPSSNHTSLHSTLNRAWIKSEKEQAVARWAFEHGRAAGWGTDTLPLASARYLPLQTSSRKTLGVLAYRPEDEHPLTQDEEQLLAAVSHQLTLSLERERLRGESDVVERVRESERLMQTMIDSVSHELRTPLTILTGTASALASDEIANDPKRRRQLVEELSGMTERLNHIVGNLLDMSRMSSGVMSIQAEWHDVRDVVTAAIRDCEQQMRSRALTVTMPELEELPLIRIDFPLFKQALSNILSNAAAYTPPNSEIALRCEMESDQLHVIVEDNGPGIPKAALPHIFEKFYRVKGSPSGGVGLGLAIAKTIIEAHGGHIEAVNRPVSGARLTIVLPTEAQPSVPHEGAQDKLP